MRGLVVAAVLGLGWPAVAAAQDSFGSGWAVPTIDTAIAIGNDVLTREISLEVLEKEQRAKRGAAPVRQDAAKAPANNPFRAALETGGGGASAVTTFRRTPEATRAAQASILAGVRARQPEAEAEYRRVLEGSDWAAAFDAMVKDYGLRSIDAADTLTAYWALAWTVANKAPLPTPKAVAAARRQVGAGFARTSLGRMSERDRQMLADETIFNFLVLQQAQQVAPRQGMADRLADATQRNFLALGTDLRAVTLGEAGFVAK